MRAIDAALLAGRVLFGGFFVFAGVNHFTNASGVAAGAASQGVPFPMLAGLGTGALLLVGGVSVLLGLAPRLGLAALVVFLVGVTPVMHAFWAMEGEARMLQRTFFLRNVALLGAALALYAVPTPWAASAGAWLAHRRAARVARGRAA